MAQIYLISPEKINNINDFADNLTIALKTGLVKIFQLRLKGYDDSLVKQYCLILKDICRNYHCKIILNDNYKLAFELGLDGVHMGQDDGKIQSARSFAGKDFIIGASCYDVKDLAIRAVKNGANYLSFGTFFHSNTKNSIGKPKPEILKWAKEKFPQNIEICAIGGINNNNVKLICENKADLISVISYIWQNPEGIEFALKSLMREIYS